MANLVVAAQKRLPRTFGGRAAFAAAAALLGAGARRPFL